MFLFDSADKEQYDNQRFMAAIHGVDIEGDKEKTSASQSIDVELEKEPFVFRDPKDYEHLSQDERGSITQGMLKHWKKFSLHSSPKKS